MNRSRRLGNSSSSSSSNGGKSRGGYYVTVCNRNNINVCIGSHVDGSNNVGICRECRG